MIINDLEANEELVQLQLNKQILKKSNYNSENIIIGKINLVNENQIKSN